MVKNSIRFVETTADLEGEARRMIDDVLMMRGDLVDGEREIGQKKVVVRDGEVWVDGVQADFDLKPTVENFVAIQRLYGLMISLMPSGDW